MKIGENKWACQRCSHVSDTDNTVVMSTVSMMEIEEGERGAAPVVIGLCQDCQTRWKELQRDIFGKFIAMHDFTDVCESKEEKTRRLVAIFQKQAELLNDHVQLLRDGGV